ncbi:P-loop containing nucleoside triphosphate hydrolase [Abortiporus biennis]
MNSSSSSHAQSSQLYPPGRRRSISDPLAVALLPPANETPEERERRLRAEEDAKKRSDNIDKMLKEGERRSRKKKVVKVLLLGQSESGKSTTLKQFQLLHTPAEFHAERTAWRFVIYLNLLRSVRRILEAIAPEADTLANGLDEFDDYGDTGETASIIISGSGASTSNHGTQVPGYESYRKRLAPLAELETRLMLQLSDPEDNDEHEPTHLPLQWKGSHTQGVVPPTSPSWTTSPNSSISGTDELVLPTSSNWRKALRIDRNANPKSPHGGELQGWWEDPTDPVHVLNRCAPAIVELWKDPKVRQKLVEKKLRLEETGGFYLDAIDRITSKMYFPTDDDVLRARLKTTGVVEHTFTMSKSSEFRGVDWKIYDVGGARNQRHAWAPYFDDVNAIIFLAPISAFDQVLAEDTRVNRLEDSLYLFKLVVSNRLLSKVNIMLFLNKIDLLKAKIDSGVRLAHYLPAYRNQPNDYENVSRYFKNKFGAVHQSHTPNKERELYIHFTSVTDTRRTHVIICNVRDMILTGNLRSSSLM